MHESAVEPEAIHSPQTLVARQVPAVTRAVAILRLLAKTKEPTGVNAIARALDLIPSTCLHIMRALVEEGFVAFDTRTKRYRLDAGILVIARSMLQQGGFAQIVQPALDDLAHRYEITAMSLRPVGVHHIVVDAISRSERAMHIHVDIGSRFPAFISASGRCLAAFGGYSAGDIRRGFDALRWENAPAFAVWLAQVETVRRNGYSVDDGQYVRGLTILSAPVLDGGRISDLLTVVGLRDQIRKIGAAKLGRALRDAAQAMSHQLGGTG